jgi:hypothetical protein
MPKNKKESFVFTIMMCSMMVLVMSAYNALRIHGQSHMFFKSVLIGFPLGFAVAFLADWFVVGPLAKKIAFMFIQKEDTLRKKGMIISICMVTGMVIVMSLFGAVMGVGISQSTFKIWLINMPMNFVVALPLQLLLVGPAVRRGFSKLYRTA